MKRGSRHYEKTWMIFLQDMLLSLLASLASMLIVRWVSEPIPQFTILIAKWLLVSLLGSVVGALVAGSHKDIRRFSTVRSIAKTIVAIFIKGCFLSLALLVHFVVLSSPAYGVLAILCDLLLTGCLLVYIRASARLLGRDEAPIEKKAGQKTALVDGTSPSAIQLADELRKEGYDVLGLITHDRDLSGRVIADLVIYHIATSEDLSRLQWRLGGVDGIFFPRTEPDKPLSEDEQLAQSQQYSDGMSLLGHGLKRSFDIGLSSLLLLIFSPVIALCALLIRREDGKPVIYSQERIGRGGKPFFIYKFRTMRTDAEQAGCPALYSGEDDPRLTRTGRFLRAHHLDELPQLWNVLKGDMSFIGYRPERQFYIDQIMAYNARYRYLYQIRPGVTSYATLYNGYTDSLPKMLTRLDLDLYYLRNHSVWFDMKVLGLTFLSIVSGKKF